RLTWSSHSPFLCYSCAVVAVAVATLLTLLTLPLTGGIRLPFMLIIVTLAAWFGGRRVALLTTVLGALAFSYFILPPYFAFSVGPSDLVTVGSFVVLALLITSFTTALPPWVQHRHEQQVREQVLAAARTQSEVLHHRVLDRIAAGVVLVG